MALNWEEGRAPVVGEYLELRAAAGLDPRRPAAAARGLAGGLHSVTVREGGRLVAMGRVVGDGGLAATLVDIAVDPGWRGRGIGGELVARLVQWCEESLPESCHVGLIADPGTFGICKRAGLEIRTGMGRTLRR